MCKLSVIGKYVFNQMKLLNGKVEDKSFYLIKYFIEDIPKIMLLFGSFFALLNKYNWRPLCAGLIDI